jgi:hypothetical protein
MKHLTIFLVATLLASSFCFAQRTVSHQLIYQSYRQGVEKQDTSFSIVKHCKNQISITDSVKHLSQTIPGLAKAVTYINYDSLIGFCQLNYSENENYIGGEATQSVYYQKMPYYMEGIKPMLKATPLNIFEMGKHSVYNPGSEFFVILEEDLILK